MVIEALQEAVPFHFVGKHSAYAVRITRDDFAGWDAQLAPARDAQQVRSPPPPGHETRLQNPTPTRSTGRPPDPRTGSHPDANPPPMICRMFTRTRWAGLAASAC